ncbi:MAG: hypothetical protein AAF497_28750 [Planctomycetota bacterium]
MHTVELMEQAVGAAEVLGYGIRQEFLGGVGGGACEIAGRRWIFVDLALNAHEQLGQVIEALRTDEGVYALSLSPELADLVRARRAA